MIPVDVRTLTMLLGVPHRVGMIPDVGRIVGGRVSVPHRVGMILDCGIAQRYTRVFPTAWG